MKALVKKRAEEGLWLEDVPIPEIAGNEVLIKDEVAYAERRPSRICS